jgi:hypothetical protein
MCKKSAVRQVDRRDPNRIARLHRVQVTLGILEIVERERGLDGERKNGRFRREIRRPLRAVVAQVGQQQRGAGRGQRDRRRREHHDHELPA